MTSPINSNLMHSPAALATEQQPKRRAKTTHVSSPGDNSNAAFAVTKSTSSQDLHRIAATLRLDPSHSASAQESETRDEQSIDDRRVPQAEVVKLANQWAQDEVNDKHKRYGPASSEFIGVFAEIVKANPVENGLTQLTDMAKVES